MRNLPLLFTAAVFAAAGVGFCRARRAQSESALPAFAPAPGAQLEALTPPRGAHTLAGQVVDIDSQPAPGVTVFLRSNQTPFWTETDSEGRFHLRELGEGPYEVALVKWGFPPRIVRVNAPSDDARLTLAPPKPPPAPLPAISASALSGRVAHPLGDIWEDPDGYELQFTPRSDVTELKGAVHRRVATDRRGFFAVEDLAHGDYQVRVTPSWAAGGSWPDLVALSDAQWEHRAGGSDFAVFGLEAGAIEATVVDPRGVAIDGAYAILAEASNPARVWPPRMSDAFGVLRFPDLPPGRYLLAIRAGESAIEELRVDVTSSTVARPVVPPVTVRKR